MDKEDDVEVTLYYLIDPITNDVRYIGRTKNTLNRRLNGHLSKARKGNKSHKNDWIRSILSKGLKPKIAEIKKVSGWRGSHIRFNSHNDCLKFLGKTSSSYIHTYLNKDIICQNKYKIKSTNE